MERREVGKREGESEEKEDSGRNEKKGEECGRYGGGGVKEG